MSGQKTEKATPRKRREARREGQIARSPEVAAWLSVLALSFLVQLAVHLGAGGLRELFEQAVVAAAEPEPAAAFRLLNRSARTAAVILAPLALGTIAVGVTANILQVGFTPSTKALKPKLNRLNPLKGARRIFSVNTAWDTVKNLIKLSVLGVAAWSSIGRTLPLLTDAGVLPLGTVVRIVASGALSLARTVAVAGLVLAVADYAIQRRLTTKRLMMAKQEVKDEHRQSEGDPQIKGAIRSRQMAMSRNRMMAEVKEADLVIVNPIHVAVALRYEADKGAPRLVAKGAGAVAARIREVAGEARVPLVEEVHLARALYRACDLGDAVPPELYDAVARVLAHVFALRAQGTLAGTHRLPGPMIQRTGS